MTKNIAFTVALTVVFAALTGCQPAAPAGPTPEQLELLKITKRQAALADHERLTKEEDERLASNERLLRNSMVDKDLFQKTLATVSETKDIIYRERAQRKKELDALK